MPQVNSGMSTGMSVSPRRPKRRNPQSQVDIDIPATGPGNVAETSISNPNILVRKPAILGSAPETPMFPNPNVLRMGPFPNPNPNPNVLVPKPDVINGEKPNVLVRKPAILNARQAVMQAMGINPSVTETSVEPNSVVSVPEKPLTPMIADEPPINPSVPNAGMQPGGDPRMQLMQQLRRSLLQRMFMGNMGNMGGGFGGSFSGLRF